MALVTNTVVQLPAEYVSAGASVVVFVTHCWADVRRVDESRRNKATVGFMMLGCWGILRLPKNSEGALYPLGSFIQSIDPGMYNMPPLKASHARNIPGYQCLVLCLPTMLLPPTCPRPECCMPRAIHRDA